MALFPLRTTVSSSSGRLDFAFTFQVNYALFFIPGSPAFPTSVGQATATSTPSAWAIIAGDPSGFFAIDSSGNLTTTAAATAGLTTHQIITLTLQATRAGNVCAGIVQVDVAVTGPSPPTGLVGIPS